MLAVALLALVSAPRRFLVCVDPGHPSERNSGGAVVDGLREVDVNWKVARLVGVKLRARHIGVVFTKTRLDQYVTNRQRAAIANRSRCNLMVRIHADSGRRGGFGVYYPSHPGTALGKTGPSPQVIAASTHAARLFHLGVAEELRGQLPDDGLYGDDKSFVGRQQGALTASVFSQVPVVLIEIGFLDNPHDSQWLKVPANLDRMADAIVQGIEAVRESG
ncbi:MAG TPA: N-acetylmuramoyl-L-alanine amidase [Fimbriimonadaceae bacterium]|nr:N-acetylmuramoyl-L-alanine amidase [Fimbriimonadaceae bacterium]